MNPISIEIPAPITTARLLIRPIEESDAAALDEAFEESKNEIGRWMPWALAVQQTHTSLPWVRKAIARWMLREELSWSIIDRETGVFIGSIRLRDIKWDVPRFEIAYWLKTSATGKGYMTEAAQALTLYCFKQLKAARVEISCDKDNTKSRAIPERLAFTFEGYLKNYERLPQGTFSCIAVYAHDTLTTVPPLKADW